MADSLLPGDPKEVARLKAVTDELDSARANLAAKGKAYQDAAVRGESRQTLMAKRMEDDAKARLEAAYRAYRELPHELKAWNAGGLVTAKYEEIAAKHGVKLEAGGKYARPGPKGHVEP